jgi:cytochrome bd ubiquinol oxidase subunit II
MTEIIIAVLCISVLLYVLLGGADFGAGIVEIITGRKGINTISKAIAPVWEANHVWIILAIVILFNGFPVVYTTLTTYLHIPLLLVLIGIIIRGSAFTFRYYDIDKGSSHVYYSWFFKMASLLTPFFMGIVLGAVILGRIPAEPLGSFSAVFMAPWLNWFTFTTGVFVTLLFAWIASVYLIGETADETYPLFARTSVILYVLLVISGLGVFVSAEFYGVHLFKRFMGSYISIACVVVNTMLIPLIWLQVKKRHVLWTRLLTGLQTVLILIGWFAIQYPVMIYLSNGAHLTVWNSQAPHITMYYLLLALLVGIFIIFPAFAYLFNVFKFKGGEQVANGNVNSGSKAMD